MITYDGLIEIDGVSNFRLRVQGKDHSIDIWIEKKEVGRFDRVPGTWINLSIRTAKLLISEISEAIKSTPEIKKDPSEQLHSRTKKRTWSIKG